MFWQEEMVAIMTAIINSSIGKYFMANIKQTQIDGTARKRLRSISTSNFWLGKLVHLILTNYMSAIYNRKILLHNSKY